MTFPNQASRADLNKPLKGKLRLRTTYIPGTRSWLNTTVGPRGFKHLGRGDWEIAATHFRRRLITALTQRFDQVVVRRETREGAERCVVECADARPETADDCECVCLGANHGQGDTGWMHVGERLLIRPGVILLTTTIYRRPPTAPHPLIG